MNAKQEIVPAETTQLVKYDKFEESLKKFEKEFGAVVYDFTDKRQAAAARSDWPKVSKVIKALEEYRKQGKAEAQAIVNLWDSKAKPIRERLEAVRDRIRTQIDAHEKQLAEEERKKAEHAAMLEKKVADIRAFASTDGMPTLDSVGLNEHIAALKAIDIDESYEHLQDEAMLAHVETMDILEQRLAERLKYEADQAELEKLRKEKEERDAREAEEARKKAEAEAVRIKAEELVAKQKEEAERAASLANVETTPAPPFPTEILPDNMPDNVKAIFPADKELPKSAITKTGKALIHSDARDSLVKSIPGLTEHMATEIVKSVVMGKIRHIYISYPETEGADSNG